MAEPGSKRDAEQRAGDSAAATPASDPNAKLKKALISVANPLALLEMAHDSIIVRDVESVVQFWNRGAADLYGWTAEEATGQVTHTLLDTKFPTSKEDVDWSLVNIGHWEGELSHRCKNGTRITVASRQALRRDEDSKPAFILEINRDITQERRQKGYLRLQQEAAVAASEAASIDEAVQTCLVSVCSNTGWCVGRAYVRVEYRAEFENNGVWYFNDPKRFESFRTFSELNPQTLEAGLAGRVIRTGQPVVISQLEKDEYFSSAPAVNEAGLISAFGMPVRVGNDVVAVLELFSDTPVEQDPVFLDVFKTVARQLARVFERISATDSQRKLSASLLRSQDDERRRIARNLHDSAGQYLAGINMCIDSARRHAQELPAAVMQKLEEAADMVKRCESEVRTLSHLLHPPLIEELGLASAVNWYVEGFASRSEMKVDLRISPGLSRLDAAIELTLFRVLQECLTNIHRHSGSKTATVRIDVDPNKATLEVTDQGKGISARTLEQWSITGPRLGVGISGIRERVKDLGGKVDITSGTQGTTVRVEIPVRPGSANRANAPAGPDAMKEQN